MRILLIGAGAAFSTRDVEDGYLGALRATSGVEVFHYALDARLSLAREWLHKLWRARGKVPEQRPTWPDTIYRGSVEAFEMALRYDVDWVVVISAMYFHPDVLGLMRRANLRTAVLFTESPYEDEKQARVSALTDICWTTERTSTGRLGARYLRHAYAPEWHRPSDGTDEYKHDVVFVGTGFKERIEMLESVNWDGIDLGLYGEWSLLGSRHKLRRYVRGHYTDNAKTVALYRCARIGLNLHRSSVTYGRSVPRTIGAESMNPRAYELAACQVFSVSDWRPELHETLGDAVPTFSTSAQLEHLVRTYLNNSPERRRLARLARQRILPHTFAARAAQLVSDLEGSMHEWQSSTAARTA